MAKQQSRRSVSVRGATYSLVRDDCAARISMSDYIEGLIAADRAARGLKVPPPSPRTAAPLPSQSVIKVGPPVEQMKLIERTPARRCTYTMGAFSCRADAGKDGRCGKHPLQGSAWRGKMAPRPEEAQAIKDARTELPKAVPARTGVVVSRPRGATVDAAPKMPSGQALQQAVRVDPVGAVHGGRAGMVGF